MPQINLQDIHEGVRVKLKSDSEKSLWEQIEKKGVTEAARDTGFSRTQIYNWKNKDVHLPIGFVRNFLKEFSVKSLKAGGRSQRIEVSFPLKVSNEFLTRMSESVNVNKEGVPLYYTDELSLIERFNALLEQLFGLQGSIYSRSGLELRFPKIIYLLCRDLSYEPDLAALIDEKGVIQDGKIILEDRKIDVDEFEGDLYSKEKRFELAIARQDSELVENIISEEVEKVRELT